VRGKNLAILFGFLALTLGGGFLVGRGIAPAIPGWYAGLAKPPFNPPDWVFAPVWTGLYILMAVAGWRITLKTRLFSPPMRGWLYQLAFNFLWPSIFFGLHSLGGGLLVILLVWFWLLRTAASFWRVDRISGLLMLPTLLWVCFAAVLNWEIWRMNG
jgi:translocator protein